MSHGVQLQSPPTEARPVLGQFRIADGFLLISTTCSELRFWSRQNSEGDSSLLASKMKCGKSLAKAVTPSTLPLMLDWRAGQQKHNHINVLTWISILQYLPLFHIIQYHISHYLTHTISYHFTYIILYHIICSTTWTTISHLRASSASACWRIERAPPAQWRPHRAPPPCWGRSASPWRGSPLAATIVTATWPIWRNLTQLAVQNTKMSGQKNGWSNKIKLHHKFQVNQNNGWSNK